MTCSCWGGHGKGMNNCKPVKQNKLSTLVFAFRAYVSLMPMEIRCAPRFPWAGFDDANLIIQKQNQNISFFLKKKKEDHLLTHQTIQYTQLKTF